MNKVYTVLCLSFVILVGSLFTIYEDNKVSFNINGKNYMVDSSNEINYYEYDNSSDFIIKENALFCSSFIGNNRLTTNNAVNLGKVTDKYVVVSVKSLFGNDRLVKINLEDNDYIFMQENKNSISMKDLMFVICSNLLLGVYIFINKKKSFL